MSKERVNNVLENAYKTLVNETTEAMVKIFEDAEVEVGKNFTDRMKELIYDSLIMKVE